MSFKKLTEEESLHRHLEQKSVGDLLRAMNAEDIKVAHAVTKVLPNIEEFVKHLILKVKEGGRLFYIGAGTSGRLGIVDASECPPTFGVDHGLVIGIIAGGDSAIRKSVEFAEDDTNQAWLDLSAHGIDALDTVVGIASSGTTPYVVHGLKCCREHRISTACISSNPGSPVSQYADYLIELELGPEFISGSTRLKSGTAQKMVLNMISTCLMIGLGRIKDNKMVDMQLSNDKLIQRGIRIIQKSFSISDEQAKTLLKELGSVRNVLEKLSNSNPLT